MIIKMLDSITTQQVLRVDIDRSIDVMRVCFDKISISDIYQITDKLKVAYIKRESYNNREIAYFKILNGEQNDL